MQRSDAYAVLADELSRLSRLPREALLARTKLAPEHKKVWIGSDELEIELRVSWDDLRSDRVIAVAVARGPGTWRLEKLEERCVIHLLRD